MNAVLCKTISVLGVEFEAECEFDFSYKEWNERHPYGMGYATERMSEVSDIEPQYWAPTEDLAPIIAKTLRERFPRLTEEQVAILVPRIEERIEKRLENADCFDFADEDEFIDKANDSID